MRFFLLVMGLSIALLSPSANAGNEDCLACHDNPTITGKKNKNPYIDPLRFASTSHAGVGCQSCHNADLAGHPDNGKQVSKANCQDCHSEIRSVYDKSIHGSNAACGECHNPHNARPPSSVSGTDINNQCNKCHEFAQTLGTHSKWLPQARLHMDGVPCISCHSESKNYVITLFLQKKDKNDYKNMTNYELGRILPKGSQPAQWIDTDKDDKISLQELRDFNLKNRPRDVRLWGMMMPEKVDHNFQLLMNRRDCSFCHVSGPEARQTSYVAFPERDGSYARLEVEKGAVLDVLFGTPDFYMIGSTRSPILSALGLLITLGGLGFVIVHGTGRLLTRKNREQKSH